MGVLLGCQAKKFISLICWMTTAVRGKGGKSVGWSSTRPKQDNDDERRQRPLGLFTDVCIDKDVEGTLEVTDWQLAVDLVNDLQSSTCREAANYPTSPRAHNGAEAPPAGSNWQQLAATGYLSLYLTWAPQRLSSTLGAHSVVPHQLLHFELQVPAQCSTPISLSSLPAAPGTMSSARRNDWSASLPQTCAGWRSCFRLQTGEAEADGRYKGTGT